MSRNKERGVFVQKQQGFTLVELMLSMAFISVMLIAITLCIIQISTIYTRGETLRQVNQSSRVVANDLRRVFADSQIDSIEIAGDRGRLCMGQYTYIWTTPAMAEPASGSKNRYGDVNGDDIRFARIVDMGGKYCDGSEDGLLNEYINVATASPVELLEEGDRSLRIRDFQVTPAAQTERSGQGLYLIRVVLGTDNTDAITQTGDACRPPADASSDLNYCAVNDFTLTVRAGIR